MEFRILGPLQIVDDGGADVELAPGQRRAVVIDLLLNRGRPVTIDRLVEDIWDSKPPSTAEKIVQLHVSQLRRALGGDRIDRVDGGYVLKVDQDEVDEGRARELAATALEAPSQERVRLLRAALALWRGPALVDVRDHEFARPDALRLEELRDSLEEQLVEARLESGEAAELIPDLEALVHAQPLREHLRALLMLALYRAGRQADALEVYRDGRVRLRDDLGLDPTPELRQLERAILEHDAALAAPPRPARSRGAGYAHPVAAAAVVLVVGVLAAMLVWLLWPTGAPARPAANTALQLNGRDGRFERSLRVGSTPRTVAIDGSDLWVGNFGDQTVTRVDLKTGQAVVVGLAAPPTSLAPQGDGVWVATSFAPKLVELDPQTAQQIAKVTLPAPADAIAATPTDVWTINQQAGVLIHVDPTSGRARTELRHLGGPTAIVFDGHSLWVAASFAKRLLQINPKTLHVASYPLALAPKNLAIGCGSAWLTDPGDNEITQFDLRDHATQTIAVGDNPTGVSAAGTSAWVTNDLSHSAQQIDCPTHTVVRTIQFGSNQPGKPKLSPTAVAASPRAVWITLQHF